MYVRVAITVGVAIGIPMSCSTQIDAADTYLQSMTDSVVTLFF